MTLAYDKEILIQGYHIHLHTGLLVQSNRIGRRQKMNALIFTSDLESLHTFCSKALFIQTLTKIM